MLFISKASSCRLHHLKLLNFLGLLIKQLVEL